MNYPRSVPRIEGFIVDLGVVLSNKLLLEILCESEVMLTNDY